LADGIADGPRVAICLHFNERYRIVGEEKVDSARGGGDLSPNGSASGFQSARESTLECMFATWCTIAPGHPCFPPLIGLGVKKVTTAATKNCYRVVIAILKKEV